MTGHDPESFFDKDGTALRQITTVHKGREDAFPIHP
jgi:hypothetical protein